MEGCASEVPLKERLMYIGAVVFALARSLPRCGCLCSRAAAAMQVMVASAACPYLSCCSLASDRCYHNLSWYLFPQFSSFPGLVARTRAQRMESSLYRVFGASGQPEPTAPSSLACTAKHQQRRHPTTGSGQPPKHHAPAAASEAASPSSRQQQARNSNRAC